MTPESQGTQIHTDDKPTGLYIPLWVALVGMVVGVIIAGVILVNVLQPLINLIFPSTPEVPLPAGTVEISHEDTSAISGEEWLYGVNMDACKVAQFFIDEGGRCRISPFVCTSGEDGPELIASQTTSVGSCEGGQKDTINSYTWEIYISASDNEYDTLFRVFLYKER